MAEIDRLRAEVATARAGGYEAGQRNTQKRAMALLTRGREWDAYMLVEALSITQEPKP